MLVSKIFVLLLHICKRIIMNNLFIEDKSDLLHDSWMLSRPTTSTIWYEKLSKSSKDEILPENLKSVGNILSDEECLIMSKISKLDPMFSVGVGDCIMKRSVVCRVEPQKINPLTRPGKFPCQKPNYFGRRKSLLPVEKSARRTTLFSFHR